MTDFSERISLARKEAESLKEKIKIKKDSFADTTCLSPAPSTNVHDNFM